MVKCFVIIVVVFASGCLCRVTPEDVSTQSDTRAGTTDIPSDQENKTADPENKQALPEQRKADEEEKSGNRETTETIAETKSADPEKEKNGAKTTEAKTGAVDGASTEINIDIRTGSSSTEKIEDSQLSKRADKNDTSDTELKSTKHGDDVLQSRSGTIKTTIASTDDSSHIHIKEGRRAPREKSDEDVDETSQTRKSDENSPSNNELKTSSDGESKSSDDDDESQSRKASPDNEQNIDDNQDDLRMDKLFDDSTEDLQTRRMNSQPNDDLQTRRMNSHPNDDLQTRRMNSHTNDDLQTRRMNSHPNDETHEVIDVGEGRMAQREDDKISKAPVAYRGSSQAAESSIDDCNSRFDTRASQHLKSDYPFTILEELTLPHSPILKTSETSSAEDVVTIAKLVPVDSFRRFSFNPTQNSREHNLNIQFPFPRLDSEAQLKPLFQKPQAPFKPSFQESHAPFNPSYQESYAPFKPLLQESQVQFKPFFLEPQAPFKPLFQDSQVQFKPSSLQKPQAPFKLPSFQEVPVFDLSSLPQFTERPLKLPPLPLNQRPFQHQEPWDPNCLLCNQQRRNWQHQPQHQRVERFVAPPTMADLEDLQTLLNLGLK